MKLIVQIPCLNEEATLPATVRDIPRNIPGIDCVEILIVDDGCTDRTVAVAYKTASITSSDLRAIAAWAMPLPPDRIAALALGADIIVNTDGDNQYDGHDIPSLVQPILDGRADIVIGDRQPGKIAHFSFVEKQLQSLGSRVVSHLAGVSVPDVASGFRAYSREAALRLVNSTDFDHTVDHVIQAGRRRIVVRNVPIRTNEKLRESRLFSNIWTFVSRSLSIIIRVYASYRALVIFNIAGLATGGIGCLLGLRFLYIYFCEPSTRDLHVQSLILAAVLLLAGFQMILTGIVADLMNSSRTIVEDILYRVRRMELDRSPSNALEHLQEEDALDPAANRRKAA